MPSTGIINGHDLRVYTDAATPSTDVAIAKATECSISMSAQMREVAHKDTSGSAGGWKEVLPGQKSATITCSALYAESDDLEDLFDNFDNGTSCIVEFKTATSGDKYFRAATAYITSLEQNAPDN